MKLKGITYLAILLVITGTHVGVWYLTKTSEQGKQAIIIKELKKKEAENVQIIEKEKVAIEVKYRDRVKTVYKMADPTGCLDTTLGTAGLFP